MRKKIMAVVLSCVMLLSVVLSCYLRPLQVSAVSTDQITTTAVELIVKSEGTYGSVNPNDCGAVSIGLLQWHANRALQLMQSIANADSSTAESILGSTFYNEVVTASNWTSRTFSSSETSAASSLLTTSTGISIQDSLAYSDVQGYILTGQSIGLTDPCVLVYYADLYNRGSGIAARIVGAASTGSYSSITLSQIHSAALSDSSNSSGYYTERLNTLYNTLASLGWSEVDTTVEVETETTEAVETTAVAEIVETTETSETVITISDTPSDFSESYAGEYTVDATSLNIRSAPDTEADKIGSIANGETVIVISGNGSWAKVNYGDVTGYCSMDYLVSMVEETVTEAVETTTEVIETTTETVETTETTTEATTETTTSTEETTVTEMTTTTTTETVTETTTTTTTEWVPATTTEVEGVSDPEFATIYGDINCDGVVDAADAVLLQRYLYGYVELNDRQLANADCRRDNVLDGTDVTVIMQYLIQNLTAMPIV